MPFTWTSELELGVEEIDEQHRELFRRAERLYHAMRQGQPLAAEAMLASFRDFVFSHFEFEERWMRRAEFPGLDGHREAHREFADRLHAITGEYRRHGPSPAVADTLREWSEAWLQEHIGGPDRLLGRWVVDTGATQMR
jgi:hemerythrin